MRDDPVLVNGIAVKAARQLVIDTAARHLFESADEYVTKLLIARAHVAVYQEIEHRRVSEFWGVPEAAILGVEHAERGGHDAVDDFRLERASAAGEGFRLGDSVFDHFGLFGNVIFLFAKSLGNREQHTFEARPTP